MDKQVTGKFFFNTSLKRDTGKIPLLVKKSIHRIKTSLIITVTTKQISSMTMIIKIIIISIITLVIIKVTKLAWKLNSGSYESCSR